MSDQQRRRVRFGAAVSSVVCVYLVFVFVFTLTSSKHYSDLGGKLAIRGAFAVIAFVGAFVSWRRLSRDSHRRE